MSTLFEPTPEPQDDREDDPMTDPTAGPTPEPLGAHRPSVLHLVVGLVFLGLAGLWGLSASGVVSSEDTWLLPGLLVVAGVAGLVAALAGGRRRMR